MVVQYRKSKGAVTTEHDPAVLKKLQTTWVAVPILIGLLLLVLSLPALSEFEQNLNATTYDETVLVEATENWQWRFYYNNQTFRPVTDENGISMTTLTLSAGKSYQFVLWSSGDKPIIHSFYIYELNFKMDVVPHTNNTIVVTIEKPGSYLILCAEYCGARHSMMRGMLEAV